MKNVQDFDWTQIKYFCVSGKERKKQKINTKVKIHIAEYLPFYGLSHFTNGEKKTAIIEIVACVS